MCSVLTVGGKSWQRCRMSLFSEMLNDLRTHGKDTARRADEDYLRWVNRMVAYRLDIDKQKPFHADMLHSSCEDVEQYLRRIGAKEACN